MEEKLGIKIGKFLVGGLVAILLTVIIQLFLAFKIIPLSGFFDWISATKNPPAILWISSLFVASITLTLRHVGVYIGVLKSLKEAKHPSAEYLFGLPILATTILGLASFLFLIFSQPICAAPSVNILVIAPTEEITQEFDGSSIEVKPNSIITFSAEEIGSSIVFCSWSYSGDAVKYISAKSSCTTQVGLVEDSGFGILTLTLKGSICPTISTRTIEIKVSP